MGGGLGATSLGNKSNHIVLYNMFIKQKTILIVNRVWFVLNFIAIALCIWFYVRIQVTIKYYKSFSPFQTLRQIEESSKTYLDISVFLLWFILIILLINIIVLFINQYKNKIA